MKATFCWKNVACGPKYGLDIVVDDNDNVLLDVVASSSCVYMDIYTEIRKNDTLSFIA